MTDEHVRFDRQGAWGVVTLARPKALNSLTREMCARIDAQLRSWADDDAVAAVLIEGEGERAFCAGGDIRWLATTARDDPQEAAGFFRTEYRLNALIARYPKPYIALMDGICMGGGVGVSAMAGRRIVTERTIWAMPECGIGMIPDVGASYVLSRMPGGLGLYLALTGDRLSGEDCLVTGIATHLVPSGGIGACRDALLGSDLSGDALAAIDRALKSHEDANPGGIVGSLKDIDHHFTAPRSLGDLMDDLDKHGGAFGEGALEKIRPGSPTSMALTFRLLKEAPATFDDCIRREFCVTAHLMEGPDFLEGVRAQIIDKDRKPAWQPSRIEDVDPARIDWYFTEPAGGPLVLD